MQRNQFLAEDLARAVSNCLWSDAMGGEFVDTKDQAEIFSLLDQMTTWREGWWFGAIQVCAHKKI
jgi:hypothetical protein